MVSVTISFWCFWFLWGLFPGPPWLSNFLRPMGVPAGPCPGTLACLCPIAAYLPLGRGSLGLLLDFFILVSSLSCPPMPHSTTHRDQQISPVPPPSEYKFQVQNICAPGKKQTITYNGKIQNLKLGLKRRSDAKAWELTGGSKMRSPALRGTSQGICPSLGAAEPCRPYTPFLANFGVLRRSAGYKKIQTESNQREGSGCPNLAPEWKMRRIRIIKSTLVPS